jgi:C_GCAxxG_C_C family probable redox protein
MLASAFGGGMARSGGTCGAVTGALMVIGYRESKKHAGDPAIKAIVYARAGEFMENFSNRFGSLTCRELTGCDLRTSEGQEKFKAIHHELCEKLVAGAVELIERE